MEGWKKYLVALAAQSALAACPLLASEPATQGDQPDLNARMNSLQAELDKLKAQQAEQQKLAVVRDQEATLGKVLTDADQHSRMFDAAGIAPITAGYDTKSHRFFIASDDGNFTWRPWIHMQFREITNDRQEFYYKTVGKDEIDNGFEMRRLRFGFDGNLFSPDLTYFFNWATARANGNATVKSSSGATVGTVSNNLGGVPILEEAWVKYNFHNTPFYVKAGQLKDPLLHDQIVSSRYQHGVERSLIADIFANGDGFAEAATLIYDPKTWVRAEAGVNHGLRSANTNFFDAAQGSPANTYDWGVAGRAEFKAFGRWQDYGQVGAVEIKEPLLVFGVGDDSSSVGHSLQSVAVVDAQYANPAGFSFYGAAVDRYTTKNFGIATQSPTGASFTANSGAGSVLGKHTNEYAVMGEVGYVFDNHIEPYGRVEYMHLQGTAAGSNNWVQVYTAGVNVFFYGNRLKITPEIIYLPKGIPIDDGPSDVFTSAPGKGEIVGEIQLQLLL